MSSNDPAEENAQSTDEDSIYDGLMQKPCRLDYLEIVESDDKPLRTKRHVIERELQKVYDAKTLQDVLLALDEASTNLQRLDVFGDIQAVVNDAGEVKDACSVILTLKEKQLYSVRIGTFLQGQDASMEARVLLRNLTGHAERITVGGEYGHNVRDFVASYTHPRPWGVPILAEVSAFQSEKQHQESSSYSEQFQGTALSATSWDGAHALTYELGWRQISDSKHTASKAVLAHLGDFLKSSLRYTFTVDERNNKHMHTNGWALRATSEVAGLSPDSRVRFAKQSVDAVLAFPLSKWVALNLGISAGAMAPWGEGGARRLTPLPDRFFLGGFGSVRGFAPRSVGPTDVRRPIQEGRAGLDSLGGDISASVAAALLFRLPHPALQGLNIHAHAFVNGGNADLLSSARQSASEGWRTFADGFRWSTGVGLVVPTPIGRLEVNWVSVLKSQETDRLRQGFQIGFNPPSSF